LTGTYPATGVLRIRIRFVYTGREGGEQMGTVHYHKTRGRPYGRFMLDYQAADGQRVRELVGPKTVKGDRATRQLAVQILRQRERDAEAGKLDPAPDRWRFIDYAAAWLTRQEARVRLATMTAYSAAIKTDLMRAPEFSDLYLHTMKRSDVEAYLARKTREGIHLASTINQRRRILRSVLAD